MRWGLDGVDADGAEQALLQGFVRETADENDLLRWCNWWPEGVLASARLESALLGGLFAREHDVRRGAYLSLSVLVKKASLSAQSLQRFADTTMEFGVSDAHWGPRAAAVVATTRLLSCLERGRVESVLHRAIADESASVRRVAGLLELALKRELQDTRA